MLLILLQPWLPSAKTCRHVAHILRPSPPEAEAAPARADTPADTPTGPN